MGGIAVLLVVMYTLQSNCEEQLFFNHNNELFRSECSKHVNLEEAVIKRYETAYIPQQVIVLLAEQGPKKLPQIVLPLKYRPTYLKIIIKDKDGIAIETELLIKRESLHSSIKRQITRSEQKIKGPVVIVIYTNRGSGSSSLWSPVVTIPESQAAEILSHMFVHSDGTLSYSP